MNELPEIQVGVLHSLSGTMAISETPLVDAAQIAVEEINQAGGVLGCQVRAIVVDGESDPDIFAAKAEELLAGKQVAAIFGCWTSSSRKAVKPVVELHNSLLWYPVQYEGLEESPNIIYTGSCLNQQIEPAVLWALARGNRRCFLIGSDYVFPRIANRLIHTLVIGEDGNILGEQYVPLDSNDFAEAVEAIKILQPDIIFNTINGEANLAFFREFTRAGLDAKTYPIISFSFSEVELQNVAKEAAGHYACWSYFHTIQTPENLQFLRNLRKRYGADRVAFDPIVTAYSQVHLWKRVVEAAGTLDIDAVLSHATGNSFLGPGGSMEIQPNHHVKKSALIGLATESGQFEIVCRSEGTLEAKPWLGFEDEKLLAGNLILDIMSQYPEAVHLNWILEQEVTRRKYAEAELQRANEQLEYQVAKRTAKLARALRVKAAFMQRMSHEMRTPLNAIIGFARLLQKQSTAELNEKQSRYVENIRHSGENLLGLINDVLDLTALETGEVELSLQPVLVSDLFVRLGNQLAEKAQNKGIHLMMDSGDPELKIWGDNARLGQILFELLDNAVKFTPEGGQISAHCLVLTLAGDRERLGFLEQFVLQKYPLDTDNWLVNSGNCIMITVADTGIGIKAEDHPKIFAQFEQVEDPLDRQQEGSGLGLALTKSLVELHGGRIWFESDGLPGEGTRFYVALPIKTEDKGESK